MNCKCPYMKKEGSFQYCACEDSLFYEEVVNRCKARISSNISYVLTSCGLTYFKVDERSSEKFEFLKVGLGSILFDHPKEHMKTINKEIKWSKEK